MSEIDKNQNFPRKRVLAMAGLCAIAVMLLGVIAIFSGSSEEIVEPQIVASPDDRILASVNDIPIYESQIRLVRPFAGQSDQDKEEPPADDQAQLLEYLIQQRLLAQSATNRGLMDDPKISNELRLAKDRILAAAMVETYLDTTVTEDDVRAYYKAERDLYPSRLQKKVRQIVLPDAATAKEIIRRLDKGDSFASLALAFSLDRASRESGGDLGYISSDMLDPLLSEQIFAKSENGRLEAFETPDGWHVVEILSQRIEPIPSFETRRNAIEVLLRAEGLQTFMEQLKSEAEIVYSESPKSTPEAHDTSQLDDKEE